MEEIAFRLATVDSILEWHNLYAQLNSVTDKTISSLHPPFRQAKVSSENASFIIKFGEFLIRQQTMTGQSSIVLVACFCSPEKSCSYLLISLTRTYFSIIPQRARSNLAPSFKH